MAEKPLALTWSNSCSPHAPEQPQRASKLPQCCAAVARQFLLCCTHLIHILCGTRCGVCSYQHWPNTWPVSAPDLPESEPRLGSMGNVGETSWPRWGSLWLSEARGEQIFGSFRVTPLSLALSLPSSTSPGQSASQRLQPAMVVRDIEGVTIITRCRCGSSGHCRKGSAAAGGLRTCIVRHAPWLGRRAQTARCRCLQQQCRPQPRPASRRSWRASPLSRSTPPALTLSGGARKATACTTRATSCRTCSAWPTLGAPGWSRVSLEAARSAGGGQDFAELSNTNTRRIGERDRKVCFARVGHAHERLAHTSAFLRCLMHASIRAHARHESCVAEKHMFNTWLGADLANHWTLEEWPHEPNKGGVRGGSR